MIKVRITADPNVSEHPIQREGGAAEAVSGKRFNASLWDPGVDPDAAAAKASEPAGWC